MDFQELLSLIQNAVFGSDRQELMRKSNWGKGSGKKVDFRSYVGGGFSALAFFVIVATILPCCVLRSP
jgi:hypothetical protein